MSEPNPGEPSAEDPRLLDALGQTALVIVGLLTSIAAEHDLSLTQARVLGILRDRRLRMTDLADYLGLERSTLSGLIDRAAGRGLVERSRSAEDGRSIEVALTDVGQQFASRAERDIAAALAPFTARLSPSERTSLTTLLERMLATGASDA